MCVKSKLVSGVYTFYIREFVQIYTQIYAIVTYLSLQYLDFFRMSGFGPSHQHPSHGPVEF